MQRSGRSFTIELIQNNVDMNDIKIEIANLLGQVIFTKINEAINKIEVKNEILKQGVYIVTLHQSNKIIGQSKLIIE